jgi:hypothetical protein
MFKAEIAAECAMCKAQFKKELADDIANQPRAEQNPNIKR